MLREPPINQKKKLLSNQTILMQPVFICRDTVYLSWHCVSFISVCGFVIFDVT